MKLARQLDGANSLGLPFTETRGLALSERHSLDLARRVFQNPLKATQRT